MIALPTQCENCGKLIETKHGLGRPPRPNLCWCRYCVRVLRNTVIENHSPTATQLLNPPTAKVESSGRFDQSLKLSDACAAPGNRTQTRQANTGLALAPKHDVQGRPAHSQVTNPLKVDRRQFQISQLQQRILEDVQLFDEFIDFRRDTRDRCTIEQVEGDQTSGWPGMAKSALNLDGFDFAWQCRFNIRSKLKKKFLQKKPIAKTLATLTVQHLIADSGDETAPINEESSAEQAASEQIEGALPAGSTPPVTKAVDRDQVQALLDQYSKPDPHSHDLVVLTSVDGFTADANELVLEDRIASWRSQWGVSLLLFDPIRFQVHFDPTDIEAYSIEDLFREHSRAKQFELVIKWFEQQLPLSQSAGSLEISQELGFDEETVRLALRVVAKKHAMKLYLTPEYGLVISDH